MTKTAIYDNPATMCREGWIDGRVVSHVTVDQMYRKGFNGHEYIPFYLNVDINFVAGRIIGDKEAIRIDL